jgi:uncharacterized protein YggL (DUF469 family)
LSNTDAVGITTRAARPTAFEALRSALHKAPLTDDRISCSHVSDLRSFAPFCERPEAQAHLRRATFTSMRRRLRKKLRVGEFTEMGFSVSAELSPDLDDAGHDAFLDRLIDAVEARRLAFGGGGRREAFEGFVTQLGRGSAAEADRTAMTTFLSSDPAVVRHDVGALIDAWNAPDDDYTL